MIGFKGHPMYHTSANLLKIFGHAQTIHGDFSIYGSSSLRHINFLPKLTCVTGDLTIAYNGALASLDGMSTRLSVGGTFSLHANPRLADMGSLGSGQLYVNGPAYILDNNKLLSLGKQGGNFHFKSKVVVEHNAVLTDITTLVQLGMATTCTPITPNKIGLYVA